VPQNKLFKENFKEEEKLAMGTDSGLTPGHTGP
jgi:hypothetical protein